MPSRSGVVHGKITPPSRRRSGWRTNVSPLQVGKFERTSGFIVSLLRGQGDVDPVRLSALHRNLRQVAAETGLANFDGVGAGRQLHFNRVTGTAVPRLAIDQHEPILWLYADRQRPVRGSLWPGGGAWRNWRRRRTRGSARPA